jgi:spore coat-associated protein N
MASETTPTEVPEPAPEAEREQASGRQRIGYLLRHSKAWLVALILLAVAVAVAAASFALFTSSSANPNNETSAGILSQSNSKDNAAILTATKMVPNDTRTGTVTIKNTGDVDGNFRLSHQDLKNYNSGGAVTTTAPLFSDVLELTVRDDTTSKTVYNGPIANLGTRTIDGTSGAGTPWKPSESHDFTFTVLFKSTGSDTTDNTYQGTKTTVQYNWDATSTK